MVGLLSFVCGCLALFSWWIPLFGLIPPVTGAILGGVGLRRTHRQVAASRPADNGLAVAGLVLSTLALVPALLILGLLVIGTLLGDGAAVRTPPPDTTLL